MWIYAFGGYIFIIVIIVGLVLLYAKMYNKVHDDGFIPVITNINNATPKQKIMAVIYILLYGYSIIWLIFAISCCEAL